MTEKLFILLPYITLSVFLTLICVYNEEHKQNKTYQGTS